MSLSLSNLTDGVTTRTPFDEMADEEERGGRDDQAAIRAEAICAWMGWLFAAGVELERVLHRLYSFTLNYRPDLLRSFNGGEVEAILKKLESDGELEQFSRAAVAAAKRRNDHLLHDCTESALPLARMLEWEEAQEPPERLVRERAFARWLGWLFGNKEGLDRAVKNLYSMARAYRPELLLDMSGSELSSLVHQTRAAESHRTLKLTETTLLRKGMKYTALPYQKSATGRAKYAAVQMGNRNRLGGKRRAA